MSAAFLVIFTRALNRCIYSKSCLSVRFRCHHNFWSRYNAWAALSSDGFFVAGGLFWWYKVITSDKVVLFICFSSVMLLNSTRNQFLVVRTKYSPLAVSDGYIIFLVLSSRDVSQTLLVPYSTFVFCHMANKVEQSFIFLLLHDPVRLTSTGWILLCGCWDHHLWEEWRPILFYSILF